jgi:hypothetical protein
VNVAGFVIEYNRLTRARRVTEFATAHEAMQYRLKLEDKRTDRNIEIVALSSKSLDTLKQTHSRYFSGEEVPEDPRMVRP